MNLEFDALGEFVWTQIWQVATVVLIVTSVTRLRGVRRRPHLGYALWLLVLLKCLTPPLVASPTGAFSWALARWEETPVVELVVSDRVAESVSTPAPIDRGPLVEEPMPQDVDGRALLPTNDVSRIEVSEVLVSTPEKTTNSWLAGAVIVSLWAFGALVYAVVSLFRLDRMRRQLAREYKHDSENLIAVVAEVAKIVGLRKCPRVVVTSGSFGPALVGLFRPMLVMPEAVRQQLSNDQLRLVVAHELVHLRRRDQWIGLVQFVAQTIWWFNPFVWWANREINRVREQCCDEEVVAGLRCEPASYAQTLVDILRLGPRQRPVLFASSVRALQVTEQRLEHIMSDAARFKRRTPHFYWAVAGLVALLVLPGAGLALDESPPTKGPSEQVNGEKQQEGVAARGNLRNGSITYTGRVVDKATGKAIEGAVVKMRQRKQESNADAKTTEHRTDARGEFSFLLPVERESDYLSYRLYAEVEHPQYVRRAIGEWGARGGEPFFRQLEMYRGAEIWGTIETPEGERSKNTRIAVYSVPDQDDRWNQLELTSSTTTDGEGRFRVMAAQAGEAAVWVVPDELAPLAIDLGGKRGDLGAVRLEKGLRLNGRVVDYEGQPVSGARIMATLNDRILSQIGPPLGGNEMRRNGVTDAEGRFRLAPLRPGNYRLIVDTSALRKDRTAALEPVFPSSMVRLIEESQSIEIKPAERVTVEVRCVDTSGRPVAGVRFSISGDDYYHAQYQNVADTGEDGQTTLAWPKGFRATLAVFSNNPELLYRTMESASRPGDFELLRLGRVDKDIRNIEVVQYKAAKLLVKAVSESGDLIADFKPEIRYSATPASTSSWVARGWRTEVPFIKLPDGRWQSERLFPNEEFTISPTGSQVQAHSQKLKLAEGEIKEVVLTLPAEGVGKKSDRPAREGPSKTEGNNDDKVEATKGAAPVTNEAKPPAAAFTNSIGMRFMLIPAGEFVMGSPEDEEGRDDPPGSRISDELPHTVRITRSFYMGIYEVTQEEYEAITGKNPSRNSKNGEFSRFVKDLDTKRFPVENVSWFTAEEFCKRLSTKEGKAYRLPTEAEWEYACRAGTTTPFSFGRTCDGTQANFFGQSPYGTETKGPDVGRPTVVGSYKPNAFGLYDMHGNIYEWCNDWYASGYYPMSPRDDPPGIRATDLNPLSERVRMGTISRVARGGAYYDEPHRGRSANRSSFHPDKGLNCGIRLVCEVPQVRKD